MYPEIWVSGSPRTRSENGSAIIKLPPPKKIFLWSLPSYGAVQFWIFYNWSSFGNLDGTMFWVIFNVCFVSFEGIRITPWLSNRVPPGWWSAAVCRSGLCAIRLGSKLQVRWHEENDVLFSRWHRQTRKKETRVLLSGVETKTFRLLVRMLYHWATGDSRELRPLNWVHGTTSCILLGLECQCVAFAEWNKCDGVFYIWWMSGSKKSIKQTEVNLAKTFGSSKIA